MPISAKVIGPAPRGRDPLCLSLKVPVARSFSHTWKDWSFVLVSSQTRNRSIRCVRYTTSETIVFGGVTNLLDSPRPSRGLHCYVGLQRCMKNQVNLRRSWNGVRARPSEEREGHTFRIGLYRLTFPIYSSIRKDSFCHLVCSLIGLFACRR